MTASLRARPAWSALEHHFAGIRNLHLRDDVDAVDDERALAWHAQRNVKDRPVLGRVDPVAAEHRVRPLGEVRLVG